QLEREQIMRRYRLQDELQPVGTQQSIKHLALSGQTPVAAHVPVVYGCSHACTFCIIPFRRGVERSRPVDEIVSEIRGLVAQGVREVTLLGQIVDRYGYDWRGELGHSRTVAAYQGRENAGDQRSEIGDRRSEIDSGPAQSPISNLQSQFDLADLLHAVHEI